MTAADKIRFNCVREKMPVWPTAKLGSECSAAEKMEANLRNIYPDEVVLDFEDPKQFADARDAVRAKKWSFRAVKTPRGGHIHMTFAEMENYDQAERNAIRKAVIHQFHADEQISSENMFIQIPGKEHFKSGKPAEVVENYSGDAAVLPYDVLQEITKGAEAFDVRTVMDGVGEGLRDYAAIRLATYWRQCGEAKDTVMERLREWNAKNKPPMPETALKTKVDSAFRPAKPYSWKFTGEKTPKTEMSDLIRKEADLKGEMLLSEEYPTFQSIGCGINNGVFYFGVKLWDNADKGKSLDAVITSDHRIYIDMGDKYNGIRQGFGLNYRFPFENEILDGFWKNTTEYGIKAWCNGGSKRVGSKEIYAEVLELQKWKVWHPNETTHKYHALNIISTYFMPCWEAHGRALMYGETGFGKTRQSKIYQLLAFNPIMSADFSSTSIFRSIESTCGTIIIDNFDTVEEEIRGKIIHQYQTGYLRDQKAVRNAEIKGGYRPTGFNLFSPMILNTITQVDETSENRSIITRCLKADDPRYDRLEKGNPKWQTTRDRLYTFALQEFAAVKKEYENLRNSELKNRDMEIAAPLLTLAKMIGDDLFIEMLNFYKEGITRRKVKEFRDDWLYMAYEWVVDSIADKPELEFQIKALAEAKAGDLWPDEKTRERKLHSFRVSVGKRISGNTLFGSRMKDGYKIYTIKRDDLRRLLKMKEFDELIVKLDKTNPLHPLHPLHTLHSLHPLEDEPKTSERSGLSGLSELKPRAPTPTETQKTGVEGT